MVIVCGWCHESTDGDPCAACGHEDPARPWTQRGQEPPAAPDQTSRRLAEARAAIEAAGKRATLERVAEYLDVSPRTVRRWQQMSS